MMALLGMTAASSGAMDSMFSYRLKLLEFKIFGS
jgi:hypothetical protein